MPATTDRTRRLVVVVAALCVSWALALLAAPSAAAHTELIGSDPADGAVLQSPPAAVTLTFSEELIDLQPVLLVTGPDGQAQHAGQPRLDGATLAIDVASAAPPGAYMVAYRVVSADGHPVEGQISFTLDPPAPIATSPAEASAAPPAPVPTTPPPAAASTGPTGSTSAVAPPTSDAEQRTVTTTDADVVGTSTSSSGTSGWLWVAVIAAAALASVGGIVVARRRAGRT